MLEIKDEIKDAQRLFEVKSDIISNIMNSILTLMTMGKIAEASRYQIALNRLIEEGEVYELSNLLKMIKKDIEKYKEN
jgi:putative GTP pyrophosphokinase